MKKYYLILILGFLLAYIIPLGVRPLMVPDEPRYGEIPREMLATGDFVVPRLDGLLYFEKPVMGYWLNAASIKVFGENEFAVRFASAVAAGLSALLIFLMVRRFAGGSLTGAISSMIFLTCMEVFGVGVFSVLDSMLAFFITAAMFFFFHAYSVKDALVKKNGFLICFGVFVGFAFLTKGFLALAIPVVIIVPFLIWEKKFKEMLTLPWVPLIAATIVILPWSILIYLKEPDFWRYFFWVEHIKRFTSDHAQHKASVFYFFLLFPAAAIPWTFLAPAAIRGMNRQEFSKSVVRYAACWFLFPFLFFSMSSGKLLTYILPCFSPFTILFALGLLNYMRGKSISWFNAAAVIAAGIFIILAIALTLVQHFDFFNIILYPSSWKYWAAVFSLFSFSLFMLASVEHRDIHQKIIFYAVAPMVIFSVAHFLIPDPVLASKAPGHFLINNIDKIHPSTKIVATLTPSRAVCWYYKRNDVFLIGGTGELTYGIDHEAERWRWLDIKKLGQLIRKQPGRVVLITEEDNYQKYKPELPQPVFYDDNGDFVFAQY